MFFIGIFSHIIPLIMLSIISLSMIYYGFQENITSKFESLFNKTQENSIDINIDTEFDQEINYDYFDYFLDYSANVEHQAHFPFSKTELIHSGIIKNPQNGFFKLIGSRGPPTYFL